MPQATGHRPATRRKPQTTGHRAQATGHRPQATSHEQQATGHRPQATGHTEATATSQRPKASCHSSKAAGQQPADAQTRRRCLQPVAPPADAQTQTNLQPLRTPSSPCTLVSPASLFAPLLNSSVVDDRRAQTAHQLNLGWGARPETTHDVKGGRDPISKGGVEWLHQKSCPFMNF